jgi:DNA-directed RNA polymerase subunit RPC12/RpoP
MGEIAEMMLDGTLCEGCGVFLEDGGGGYPRRCIQCEEDARIAEIDHGARQLAASMKVKCPDCGKRVKPNGLANHIRDKHPTPQGE